MSVLELRRVSKVYGQGAAEVHALREIDLSVDAGMMVAVMGPSGSGKSTLLTIAGSPEEPTGGEVCVGGAGLATMSPNAKAQLRRRVAIARAVIGRRQLLLADRTAPSQGPDSLLEQRR
jgi:putative ABC transport system ATP-binding protein